MPGWSHMHPLIVHFPIALLLTAPLLVLLGLLWPSQRAGVHFAALVLLILGTLGALLAWASGEAAVQWAQRTPELRAVLPRHEQSGQVTTLLFGALTLLFALLWLWPLVRKRTVCDGRMLLLNLLWLLASLLGVISLVRTGQLGGAHGPRPGNPPRHDGEAHWGRLATSLLASVPAWRRSAKWNCSCPRPRTDLQLMAS